MKRTKVIVVINTGAITDHFSIGKLFKSSWKRITYICDNNVDSRLNQASTSIKYRIQKIKKGKYKTIVEYNPSEIPNMPLHSTTKRCKITF